MSVLLWYAAVSSSGTTTQSPGPDGPAGPLDATEASTWGSDGAQWSRNAARTSSAGNARPDGSDQLAHRGRGARVPRAVRDGDKRRPGV